MQESEQIRQGDPLWNSIMRVWANEGKPAEVTVSGVVYRDIGDDAWVAVRRANDDMASSYNSNSISKRTERASNPDGTPARFRPTY
jgi:hypothetical protein